MYQQSVKQSVTQQPHHAPSHHRLNTPYPCVTVCHRPEEVYEVEAVFGRDAASVFPSMAKDEADPMEALKAAIGGKRFVSESEVRVWTLTVGCGTAGCFCVNVCVLFMRGKWRVDTVGGPVQSSSSGTDPSTLCTASNSFQPIPPPHPHPHHLVGLCAD